MAITTTRLNGTCSLDRGYSFYANVTIDDTIRSDSTFLVIVNCYLVNNGTRTNSGNWQKYVRINDVDSETWNDQTIDTTGVSRYGGELNVISKIFYVPITMQTIGIYTFLDKDRFTSYDPGTCIVSGYISMPKVMSTWNTSLLSIANVESSFTLPINKYGSSYYNVVEVRNGNNTTLVKTINDAVDGTSVSFSSSELNTIYTMDNNRNQLPLVFYMDLITYTNSSKTTQIGNTQRLKCEAYIVNGEPTATYTIVEQDPKVITLLSGDTSKIIKNASDLLFTITPTALKGATISSVKINNATATQSGNNYVLNVNNITTGTFSILITDSRNLTRTYTATKTVLDYIACKINTNWSIERATQTSSDLVLNASVNVWNSTINGTSNTIVAKYSLDNETWTTISSSSYTISNNVLTISNLTFSNIISYQQAGTFYLDVSDLLSESKENKAIKVGIYTCAKSDRRYRINGTLELADANGQNRINVRDYLIPKVLYSNDNGATGDITLTETANNYRYIEVFFGSDDGYSSTKFEYISSRKTKFTIRMEFINEEDSDRHFLYASTYQLSGTSITFIRASNDFLYIPGNNVGNYGTASYVKIYKVLGYK